MEDFAAGFQETVDQYGSAADWIAHHREATPAAERDGAAVDYLVILSAVADRHDVGGSAQHRVHG